VLRKVWRTSDWVCSSQAPRQDHVVAVLVELYDLRLELAADVRLEVADPSHLDQGRRQEAAQADVEDQAALDDLDDGAGDDAVLVLDLLDRAPGALVLGALLGQDEAALLVLLLEDQGLDVLADLHDLSGVDIVLDRELAGGDDTFGLVADVEQDLVSIDLDNGALNDVTVVEVLDGLVDRGEEGLLRTDVVDRYLRGVRGGLSAARHVWNCSEPDRCRCVEARQALFQSTRRCEMTEREPAPLRRARAHSAAISI